MDVILRHVLGGVPEHGADREFRKTEFASDAPERMPQGVGRDPRDPGEFANAVPPGAYSGVGAGPSFRREYVRVYDEIGRESCRERVGQYGWISVGAVTIKKKK